MIDQPEDLIIQDSESAERVLIYLEELYMREWLIWINRMGVRRIQFYDDWNVQIESQYVLERDEHMFRRDKEHRIAKRRLQCHLLPKDTAFIRDMNTSEALAYIKAKYISGHLYLRRIVNWATAVINSTKIYSKDTSAWALKKIHSIETAVETLNDTKYVYISETVAAGYILAALPSEFDYFRCLYKYRDTRIFPHSIEKLKIEIEATYASFADRPELSCTTSLLTRDSSQQASSTQYCRRGNSVHANDLRCEGYIVPRCCGEYSDLAKNCCLLKGTYLTTRERDRAKSIPDYTENLRREKTSILSIPLEIHQMIAEEFLNSSEDALSDFNAYRMTCRATSAISFPRHAYETYDFWYRHLKRSTSDGVETLRGLLQNQSASNNVVVFRILTNTYTQPSLGYSLWFSRKIVSTVLDCIDLSLPPIQKCVEPILKDLVTLSRGGRVHLRVHPSTMLHTVLEHSHGYCCMTEAAVGQRSWPFNEISSANRPISNPLVGPDVFRIHILTDVLFTSPDPYATFEITSHLVKVIETESNNASCETSSRTRMMLRYLEEAFRSTAESRLDGEDGRGGSFDHAFEKFLLAYKNKRESLLLLLEVIEGLQRPGKPFSMNERLHRADMLNILLHYLGHLDDDEEQNIRPWLDSLLLAGNCVEASLILNRLKLNDGRHSAARSLLRKLRPADPLWDWDPWYYSELLNDEDPDDEAKSWAEDVPFCDMPSNEILSDDDLSDDENVCGDRMTSLPSHRLGKHPDDRSSRRSRKSDLGERCERRAQSQQASVDRRERIRRRASRLE